LVEAATGAKTTRVVRHTPEALAEYFSSLRAQYPGRQIAVALEQSRGPLLFALLQYENRSMVTVFAPGPQSLPYDILAG
jgi:hypothetical protein